MITLNGKKFALNDQEFTETLFEHDGTAVGYYKPLKNKIRLYNMQRELIGVITQHGVLACATKTPNGAYWYSHATIKEIGENPSYMAHVEEIESALKAHNIQRVYS